MTKSLFIFSALVFVLFLSSVSSVDAYHNLTNEIWGYVHTTNAYPNVTVYACSSSSPLPSDCSSMKWFLQSATEGTQWYLGNPQSGWYYRFWAEATDGTKSNYIDVTYSGSPSFAGDLTISGASSQSSAPASAPSVSATSMTPNPNAITLSWGGVTGATYFKIYRNASFVTDFTNITYIDGNLSAGTYEYYVTACNSYGCSSGSNHVSGTISGSNATVPAAPSNLQAVLSDNYLGVNLTWVDNSGDESFFDLFYRKLSESYRQYFATVSANVIYFVHNNAPAGSLEYATKACNSIGCSPDSNAVGIIVPESVKKITGNVTRQNGQVVTDASINIRNIATNAYVYGQIDPSGNYSISLSGGNWEVSIYPNSTPADWVYNQPPQTVVFASDTTIETKTLNFAVTTTDATIKGRILKPDGTALLPEMVSFWLHGSSGSGFGGPIDTAGYFSVAVPAGTYHIYINISDHQYSAPSIPDPTVVTGATKDLGTITLVSATKTIKGKVARADGSPIADAKINVYIPNTGIGRETQTDSVGDYSITVVGGSWEMHIYPASSAANWNYDGPSRSAIFANDSAVEVKIIDFVVTTTDSTIQGKILKPDGTPPDANKVFVDVRNSSGQGTGTSLDSNGFFIAKVAAGTYNIYINVNDPLYVAPSVSPVSVISGTTQDIGTITLVKAAKIIRGTIKRSDGGAIADANVNAYQQDTKLSAFTEADSSGNYTLAVSGGSWGVSIYPKSAMANWSYTDPPKTVSFATDTSAETKVVDFVVTTTDSKIKGKILKPDGTAPSVQAVYIRFEGADGKFFSGPPAGDGSFEINIAGGTYKMFIDIQDPIYAAPKLEAVTVASGAVRDLGTITLVKATKTIKGKIAFKDGVPVTNVNVNVYQQTTGRGAMAEVDTSGNYSIAVTGGYWEIFIYPKSQDAKWSYNEPPKSVVFANDSTVEEKIVDFTAVKADAVLKGKVLKPDGTALPEGGAFVDLRANSGFSLGGPVAVSGAFNIPVPSGTYEVFIWVGVSGFNAPAVGSITIASGETKDLGTITLLRATKTIKGKVLRSDGRAVFDAGIGAYHKDTQNWIGARTDGSGNYSLTVLGGSWEIGVRPESQTPDWVYSKPPTLVIFANDQTVEETALNFTVIAADAFITGTVVKPDGSPPPANRVFVGVRTSEGFESGGGSIDSSGAFRIAVVAGSYSIGIHSDDPQLAAPELPPVNVASGQALNIGTVKLIAKTDHINGKVTDGAGVGIGGVEVNAWKPEGFGYSFTKTGSNGNYDLLVTSGTWEVFARPDPATAFYNSDPPAKITVESGKVSNVNFVFLVADAALSGTVVDDAGNVLSDLYGFIDLAKSAEFGPGGLGGPVERGSFSFKAPAGTYLASIFLPPESPYTARDAESVTLVSGATKTVTIKVSKNASIITGTLRDESGKAIIGINAKIFASSQKGSWQEARFDQTTGKYTLRVAAGTWYLGYDIDPNFGYISGHEPNIAVNVSENQTVIKDLIVKKADSIIKGQVTDPNGLAVSHAFVGVSKTSFSGISKGEGFSDPIVAGAETDANGNYTLAVPADSYFVKTFVNPERGFINSDEQNVTVVSGETKVINLKLKTADLAIGGKVLLDGEPVSGAFVWGWSQKGGYQETFTDFTGAYRLNVTSSDTWVVAAGADRDSVFYKSGETAITVANVNVALDISLVKYVSLPPTAVKTADASQPTAVQVSGGASVVVPANAISTSGSVNITVTPDTQAPSQGEIKVVGIAYDMEARDASGQTVSAFNTSVTITIPYDETTLANLGIREGDLHMAFWDETASTWKILDNAVANQTEDVLTAAVDHFTRFAVVAAADITPPEAPTKVIASALGNGEIKLSWANPSKDFDHSKVYRSATSTILGAVVASDVKQTIYTDTGVIDAKTYYYTVRSVDPAGNESANTDQVSVVASGSSAKKIVVAPVATTTATTTPPVKKALPPGQARKLKILKNLTQGDFGEDIKTLQRLLLDEGVYPEGLITGFFGTLTRQAVIRFQEKYALEILKPAGLTNGTGFVGPGTLKKVNELLSGAASAEPMQKTELPPGQTIKSAILRNLSRGIEGEDVKTLQQLLIDEGVYPEGLITGFFGSLTWQAVIRFQEKYINEILTPAGLTNGTGYVGAGTRKKIEELLK